MKRRLFLAAGLAGTIFPSRGSMATTAQVSAQTENQHLIAEAVTADLERLIALITADGGWNTDRGRAIAQNVQIASLLIDDGEYNRWIEEIIASVGGEGAFTADVVVHGADHLEQEIHSRAASSLMLPSLHMSVAEVQSALDDLRDTGLSVYLADSAAFIRKSCDEDPETEHLRRRCRELDRKLDRAQAAMAAACGVSTVSGARRLLRLSALGRIVLALACAAAIAVFLAAWVQYHANDCDNIRY